MFHLSIPPRSGKASQDHPKDSGAGGSQDGPCLWSRPSHGRAASHAATDKRTAATTAPAASHRAAPAADSMPPATGLAGSRRTRGAPHRETHRIGTRSPHIADQTRSTRLAGRRAFRGVCASAWPPCHSRRLRQQPAAPCLSQHGRQQPAASHPLHTQQQPVRHSLARTGSEHNPPFASAGDS